MDREQYVATFRGCLQDVSRYLSRRVHRDSVEDLASDVFEIAWAKRDQCPDGLELAWLFRIASYVVSNHRRKSVNRLIHFSVLDTDKSAPSAEDVALDGSNIAIAFGSLSSTDRQILSLLVFEELSVKEIAVVLAVSENTASQRIKRARERLARQISIQESDIQERGH